LPKDFVSLADWSADDLRAILARAAELKRLHKAGQRPQTLEGRSLAMFFEKPSLRTHVTFEAGMTQLGGHAILLRPEQVGIGTRESAADVATNLSRWVDVLVARTYSHSLVEELAAVATIPVVNGLTDLLHPCQVMADLQTVAERHRLEDAVIAYVGDGNNMAHSLLFGAAKAGMDIAVASPAGYTVRGEYVELARADAAAAGTTIQLTEDPEAAVVGASAVYTDVWASMGQEAEAEERLRAFAGFEVDEALMALAAPEAVFLHCLPAHRGEEVSAAVADGEQSRILDQAENRLHAQKAIMLWLMGGVEL
jgi:ornithine carbamoyltransferase